MNEENQKIVECLIYLCKCAVDQIVPDANRLEGIDMDQLFAVAEKHLISSAAGMALESAGIREERFYQAIAQAQRKNALLDADRRTVLAALENAGIWYMPLKGSILKDMYPRYGMRQMADNDILFDPEKRAELRKIMEELGFQTKKYEIMEHDVYFKEPVSNFEMHVYLINGESNERLETYYLDIKNRLIKDEGNSYGYHFSDEDFYLFMFAHEYKHFIHSGTGLRSLLDTYVYLKKKKESMDWDYIRRETAKMGIAEYEEGSRSLSERVFHSEKLDEAEQEKMAYIISSGAYGTLEHAVMRKIQKKGRLGFFLSRLTLPRKELQIKYPILKKAPFLYPFLWVWRLIRGFLFRNKKFIYETKAALGFQKKQDNQ